MFGWLKRAPRMVEYLEVKRDDSFFITADRTLTPAQREAIKAALDRFQRGEQKVLVLEGGLKVTIISRPSETT